MRWPRDLQRLPKRMAATETGSSQAGSETRGKRPLAGAGLPAETRRGIVTRHAVSATRAGHERNT